MRDTTDIPTRVISTIRDETPLEGTPIQTGVASYPAPLIEPTLHLPQIRPEDRREYTLRPVTQNPPSGEYGLSPSGQNWVIPVKQVDLIEYDGEPDFLQPDWIKLAYPDGFSAGLAAGRAYAPFATIWDFPDRGKVENAADDISADRWLALFRPLDLAMTEDEQDNYRLANQSQQKRYMHQFREGYLKGFSRGVRLIQDDDPGTPGSSWG